MPKGAEGSRRSAVIRWSLILVWPGILVLFTLNGDKNYGLLSLGLVFMAMAPFFLSFEKRRPETRELVVIAVMAGIAALGRVAFAPIPFFKPTSAVIIITALVFGPETGFLTGALAALTSNMFFGQGPWTPWQMFAWGMVGFTAGLLRNTFWMKRKVGIGVFGFLSGFVFGWTMNIWFILGFVQPITYQAVLAAYVSSLWPDFTHALSTLIFLWFLVTPWTKKLERIKTKYGIMDKKGKDSISSGDEPQVTME